MICNAVPIDEWSLSGFLGRFRGEARATPYVGKIIGSDRADEVMALARRVTGQIEDKTTFRPLGREELETFFGDRGRVLGILAEGRLIAYGLLAFPGLSGDNIGRLLALPEKSLQAVAQLESSAVDPDWRGNGLQDLVIRHRMRFALDMEFSQAMGHVSPNNPISLVNVLRCGLGIRALAERRPGYPRFICHCDQSRPVGPYLDHQSRTLEDLGAIAELLREGFHGIAFDPTTGQLHLAQPDGAAGL